MISVWKFETTRWTSRLRSKICLFKKKKLYSLFQFIQTISNYFTCLFWQYSCCSKFIFLKYIKIVHTTLFTDQNSKCKERKREKTLSSQNAINTTTKSKLVCTTLRRLMSQIFNLICVWVNTSMQKIIIKNKFTYVPVPLPLLLFYFPSEIISYQISIHVHKRAN